MAYNPFNAVKQITDYKKMYDEYEKIGDTTKRDEVAKKAQEYYGQLRQNNYGDIADRLSKSNAAAAVNIMDSLGMSGRETPRQVMPTYFKQFNIPYDDNKMTYDDLTGEAKYDNISLGKYDYMGSNDRTYFDTGRIQDFAKQYKDIVGAGTKPLDTMYNQEQQSVNENYRKLIDSVNNLENINNPLQTQWGKDIMEVFGVKGKNAADNEVATVAAGNSGNIDSFAAANAKRQQKAFSVSGIQAVEAARQQRISDVRAILSDMGVNTQNIFNNDQTAQNNQVARDTQISGVTGYNAGVMATANNPFFNPDGTLANVNTDYQSVINEAQTKLANAVTEEEKDALNKTIQDAHQARSYKITNYPDYAQYADTITSILPTKTSAQQAQDAEIDFTQQQLDQQQQQLDWQKSLGISTGSSGGSSSSRGSGGGGSAKPSLTAAQAQTAYNNGIKTPEVISAMEYHYGAGFADNTGKTTGGLSNEERVKNLIYAVPNDGSSSLYYPLQELKRDRVNYERATNTDFVNSLILEEAEKVLRAEGGKISKKNIGKILQREGFTDYKTLEKLY
jgi:hypothetical protein